MRHASRYTLAAALFLGVASVGAAESPHSFSANAALATDYVFRGISQTDEDPAIQGGFDYNGRLYLTPASRTIVPPQPGDRTSVVSIYSWRGGQSVAHYKFLGAPLFRMQ